MENRNESKAVPAFTWDNLEDKSWWYGLSREDLQSVQDNNELGNVANELKDDPSWYKRRVIRCFPSRELVKKSLREKSCFVLLRIDSTKLQESDWKSHPDDTGEYRFVSGEVAKNARLFSVAMNAGRLFRVIGIDPAPKNPATIYDGLNWTTEKAENLPAYIDSLSKCDDDLLVCWDAPLTPGQPEINDCYYIRPIESFFQNRIKTPKGISVLPYAGCPHWAVTRAAVGLPKMGRFDCQNIPLNLCATGMPVGKWKHIVEVHPAVAIWLWCKSYNTINNWNYKGNGDNRRNLWKIMMEDRINNILKPSNAPANDDEFDAYVAWLLGIRWLMGQGVILLGNADTGSFLVPCADNLQNNFKNFVENR